MIDRYLLRYFLAVIDYGNFSKAAAQCHVSQPTLSVGIAKLEQGLGRPLFRRTNRRVELTEAGVRFAVHARRIESEFNAAEQDLGAAGATKAFRLGVLTSIPTCWIEALAARLSPDLAQAPVAFVEGRERDLLERLSRGRIDAALTIIRPDDARFDSEVLRSEGYGLALPSGHALARMPVIAAEALADSVMIVRRHCEVLAETSRHFTARGVRPFFTAKTTDDNRALALVRAGFGVTVMPECFIAEGVVRPRLAGFDLVRNLGVLYGDRRNELAHCPAIEAVRHVISTVNIARSEVAAASPQAR
jgi:DNA-binding transcriptional LysR family regulator